MRVKLIAFPLNMNMTCTQYFLTNVDILRLGQGASSGVIGHARYEVSRSIYLDID